MSFLRRLTNALSLLFAVTPDAVYPLSGNKMPQKNYQYPMLMNQQLKTQYQVLRKPPVETRPVYSINIDFLRNLGFEKNDILSSPTEWVYQYYCRVKGCYGIELVFAKEYGILSVEEFWIDRSDESAYVTNSIVGKFRVCSDEDLNFIFSKNIKLNYLFNVEGKRV